MADVNITTSIQGIQSINRELDSLSSTAIDVGKSLTASLTVPLAAVSAGLIKVANDYDNATNQIIAGTGATGAALEGLQEVTRNVFTQVPTDIGNVSSVVAELNTRTGETGPALQSMATQVLEASRLLGGDATQLARGFSQTVKQFGIEADDSGRSLDEFFRIAQANGIGLNPLISQVNEYGRGS